MSHDPTPTDVVTDPESFIGQRPARPGETHDQRVERVIGQLIADGVSATAVDGVVHLMNEYGLAGLTSIVDAFSGTHAVEGVELSLASAPVLVLLPGVTPRTFVNPDHVQTAVVNDGNTTNVYVAGREGIRCDAAIDTVVAALNDAGA